MKTAERFFFPKSERLFLQKAIERLFSNGQSFLSYPLRIIYLPDNEIQNSSSGIAVLISVPKKRIKLAVNRNRIKRLIRETYRLQKNRLAKHYEQNSRRLHIAFHYIGNEMPSFTVIEKAMAKALKTIGTKENVTE